MSAMSSLRQKLGDAGYAISYGARRVLYTAFGPPTLSKEQDPTEILKRERAERRARRKATG